MILRTYKYRCYPGVQAQANANHVMRDVNKRIWNEALWHRERNRRDVVSVLAVNANLREEQQVPVPQTISPHGLYELIRTDLHPEYAGTNAQGREQVLDKLYASYQSFYALRKNGHKDARPPGRMKFCGWVIYRQSGWRLDGHTLHMAGIGSIPIRLHRPVGGKIKTVTLRVKNGRWYVCFSCEIEDFPGACRPVCEAKARKGKALGQEHPPSGGRAPQKGGTDNQARCGPPARVGGRAPQKGGTDNKPPSECVQVGGGRAPQKGGTDNQTYNLQLRTPGGRAPQKDKIAVIWLRPDDGVFLADSDSRKVAVPGFYETALPTERRLNQACSCKQNKGRNKAKAHRTLAKFREHIANQRSAFIWSEVRRYATQYAGVILFTSPAKPAIQYARDERTARGLQDGAYALFEQRLKDKCEEYGTELLIKERPQWQREKQELIAQGKIEELSRILRKAKQKVRRRVRGLPASTLSLLRACEDLTTWLIT